MEESRRLEELSGYFAEGMPQEAEIDSVKNAWTNRNEGKSLLGERNTEENPAIHTGTGRCQMLTEQEEAGKRKKMLLLLAFFYRLVVLL